MNGLERKHDFHTVYDAQAMFRLILTATANPSREVSIQPFANKLYGPFPHLLAVAMTLLDNEVGFCVRENGDLTESIAALTLSPEKLPEDADFVFVTEAAMLEDTVRRVKCGTLRDPHRSATLVVWNKDESKCALWLTGPGIAGAVTWHTTKLARLALQARDAQRFEYPEGIDFLFVSDLGMLAAIPRLIRWEDAV